MVMKNGFSLLVRPSALGAIPLDTIMRQIEQQLSSMLGTKVGLITVAVANGHLDMASGLSRERTIACLQAVLDDLKAQQGKLIVPGG